MKFIDLKTGETFDMGDIRFCGESLYNRCVSCPVRKIPKTESCQKWVMQHPLEAAKLMGYGIVGEGGDEIKFAVPVNNSGLAGDGGAGGGVQPEPLSKILIEIEPEYIWKYQRQYEEMCKAIGESLIAGETFPREWLYKGRELLKLLGKIKRPELEYGEKFRIEVAPPRSDRTFWEAIRDVVRRHYGEKLDNALKESLKMDEESK